MKLTPHQILQKLGFDIPADGVEINPTDAFLHDKALRLAGSTIDLARIPDSEFVGLHSGMAGIVAAARGEPPAPTTEHATAVTRQMVESVLRLTFGYRTSLTPYGGVTLEEKGSAWSSIGAALGGTPITLDLRAPLAILNPQGDHKAP